MSDEWEVVRGYIDQVVADAPKAFRDEAGALRERYATLEAERTGASAMIAALDNAGATITLISNPVWREAEAGFQRRWRDALSNTANLSMRIAKSRVRGGGKNIDHALDYEIGFNAVRLYVLDPKHQISAAILASAASHGVTFADAFQRSAFSKRIRRLIESPRGPGQHWLTLIRSRSGHAGQTKGGRHLMS